MATLTSALVLAAGTLSASEEIPADRGLRFQLVHPDNYKFEQDLIKWMTEGHDRREWTAPEGTVVKPFEDRYFVLEEKVVFDGSKVASTVPKTQKHYKKVLNQSILQWEYEVIEAELTPFGRMMFLQLTKENVGRQLAILLDGVVLCAPMIMSSIEGGTINIASDMPEEKKKEFLRRFPDSLNY